MLPLLLLLCCQIGKLMIFTFAAAAAAAAAARYFPLNRTPTKLLAVEHHGTEGDIKYDLWSPYKFPRVYFLPLICYNPRSLRR